MSNLQPFQFEGECIRFVGDPNEPECVGADMVAVLHPEADQRNYSNYLAKIPPDWKGHKKIMTPGGEQEMVTLKEPGIYALIARSNSPKAVPFQKWIFEEVLPAIRKFGEYRLKQEQQPSLPMALLERRERLEQIQLGMDLFAQLGGIDERTELQVKDLVRDIVLADKLKQKALTSSGEKEEKRLEYPISDRLIDLGYGVQNGSVLKSIGQIASNLYKARHGDRPPQREQ